MSSLRWVFAAGAAAILGLLAAGGAGGPVLAGEVYSTAQRCNNKDAAGRQFRQDHYVYFDTNSSRVRPDGLKKIKYVYGLAAGNRARQICLFGKASKVGDARANKALGHKRAANVARELEALGWPRSRIVIGSEGEAWGWLEEALTSDSGDDRRVRIKLSQ